MEGRPSVHPDVFPTFNPWVGVEREGEKKAKPAATRPEAYALAGALKAMGEPHLGAAALICFEKPRPLLDSFEASEPGVLISDGRIVEGRIVSLALDRAILELPTGAPVLASGRVTLEVGGVAPFAAAIATIDRGH